MEICNIAPKFNQVTFKILSFYCIFYLCFSRTIVLCINRLSFLLLFKYFFIFYLFIVLFFFPFIFISWRLITSQHCSGFCHTLTWISHGVTCIPHPDPPSHLPLHPIPLGLPSAPGPSAYLMHPTFCFQSALCIYVCMDCMVVIAQKSSPYPATIMSVLYLFFKTFYFILQCSWFTMFCWFQV